MLPMFLQWLHGVGTLLQAFSSWQLGADSRVEINKAYINTVCTGYYFQHIDDNLQKSIVSIYYQDMT